MRSFLAINFEEKVVDNLYKSVNRLKQTLGELRYSIKWVPKQNCHLTIRFLGEITEKKAIEIKEALSYLSKIVPPFILSLEGFGVFPSYWNPRVLWAGIQGDRNTLFYLYEEISNSIDKIGIPKEEREFSPHLTIGRVKKKGKGNIKEILKSVSANWGESKIDEIVLYKSKLRPEGPIYTPIWKLKLLS